MVNVQTVRLSWCLWLAWRENDFRERSIPRFGFTEAHAINRVIEAAA